MISFVIFKRAYWTDSWHFSGKGFFAENLKLRGAIGELSDKVLSFKKRDDNGCAEELPFKNEYVEAYLKIDESYSYRPLNLEYYSHKAGMLNMTADSALYDIIFNVSLTHCLLHFIICGENYYVACPIDGLYNYFSSEKVLGIISTKVVIEANAKLLSYTCRGWVDMTPTIHDRYTEIEAAVNFAYSKKLKFTSYYNWRPSIGSDGIVEFDEIPMGMPRIDIDFKDSYYYKSLKKWALVSLKVKFPSTPCIAHIGEWFYSSDGQLSTKDRERAISYHQLSQV